jgi:hypothetical protein
MDRRNLYLELAIKQELIEGRKDLLSIDIEKDEELKDLFISIIEKNSLLVDILLNVINESESEISQESETICKNTKLILSKIANNKFSLHKQTQISNNDPELYKHSVLTQYLLDQPFDSYDPYCSTIAKNYKLRYIQNNSKLYEYFDGLLFTMNQGYSVSMTLHSDKLAISGFSKFELLIMLAPILAQTPIITIEKFIMKSLMIKRATNICKFSGSIIEFESLLEGIVIDTIIKKKFSLEKINAEESISDWITKLSNRFDDNIFGSRYETAMQKLGYKDACYLLDYIGSGKIYAQQIPITISLKDKSLKLKEALESIIDQDLAELTKIVKVQEKKNSFCNIFLVKELIFSNKMLNHPKIIYSAATKQSEYNINSIINLSNMISEELADEIIIAENDDVDLAGEILACAIMSL